MSSPSAQQLFQTAIGHLNAGSVDQAESLLRQLVSRHPQNADALSLLGTLASMAGRQEEAIELLHRAISINPAAAPYHCNLAIALTAVGRIDQAIAASQKALAFQPRFPEAYISLGNALRRAARLDEAVVAFGQALALRPGIAEVHANLAGTLNAAGHFDEAIAAAQQAVALRPRFAEALVTMGNALLGQCRADQAIDAYRQALVIQPHSFDAHLGLASAYQAIGRHAEARTACEAAIAIAPGLSNGYNALGAILKEMGRLGEATSAWRRAVAIEPSNSDAHNSLGFALAAAGQVDEAIDCYRRALRLRSSNIEALNNLAGSLRDAGQMDEAIECYGRATALRPHDPVMQSNRLYALHFHPAWDAQAILREHRQWNQQHAIPLRGQIRPHGNDPTPDRRLRIGYVSSDFRDHVVGWNLLPLLRNHDRRQFEIFCYAGVLRPDAMTERICQCSDTWRTILGTGDEQVANLIRDDRIDILVELNLHSTYNRLLVFARKPAPVQVSYLGYCSTTGLDAIDYRLSDPYLDPPESGLDGYSEQTIRLPRTYWCYEPGGAAPGITPLLLTAGVVTFGCMNHFRKISPAAQELWASILRAIPRSRILIHAQKTIHLKALLDRFARQGVTSDRIEFIPRQQLLEYWATYCRIDIALDPFPYGGGITTLDGLWMGVPVVSLSGQTAVGRGGRSILNNLDLPEWVAATPEQYLQIAVDLAGDLPRLQRLRAELRDRMIASPLMDARQFARDVESAYRQMWRNWCNLAPKVPGNSDPKQG